MTRRLSGHISISGLVFFVLKSRLEIARQWSREKFAILSLKPWLYVRILIYRTWAISDDLIFQPKHDHWTHKRSQPFFILEGKNWKLWKCSQRYYGADHLTLEGFEWDGGWGGVWVISDIFRGRKYILQGNTWEKNVLHWKKNYISQGV